MALAPILPPLLYWLQIKLVFEELTGERYEIVSTQLPGVV